MTVVKLLMRGVSLVAALIWAFFCYGVASGNITDIRHIWIATSGAFAIAAVSAAIDAFKGFDQ